MLNSVWLALAVTLIVALLWLKFCDYLAARQWVSSQVSRKVIHIGTGPIFVLCWLLFPNVPLARWLAALIPLAITLKFLGVGLGLIKDERDVQSMSRIGDRRELLRGPTYYGLVFVFITLIFWKDSPVGITALMVLCGGDGLADLVGRRWGGQYPLPWSPGKSIPGSLGMLLGSVLFSSLVIWTFVQFGVLPVPFNRFIPGIVVTSLVSAAVETLPIEDYDNLTVTLSAVAMGLLIF